MEEGKLFEKQVVEIARYLWPESVVDGSIMHNGKERDGIFITEDVIHLIEVTTSKSLSKASYDIKKLLEIKDEYQRLYSEKLTKCWLITQHEPSADQRSMAIENKVNICSFENFQNKLFNATQWFVKN